MKWMLVALFLAGAGLVVWGPPGSGELPKREPLFGGDLPVLPMTFRHDDHFAVACTTCHHEFIDGTAGGTPCMTCHVTDTSVAPLLEEQFHGLCRSCHVEEHAAGKPSGPTRRCISCHLDDHQF